MHGHGATPPSAATPGKRTNRAPAPSAASPSTVLKAPPPFGRDDQPHSGVVPAEHMRSGLATSPRRLTRQLSPPSLAGAVRRAAPFGVTSDVYASRAATGADGSVSFIPASDCAPFKTAPRTDNARPAESAPRARHRKPGADAAIWGLSGDGGSPIAHDDDAAVAERVSANVAFFRYDSRERGYEPQSHLKARKGHGPHSTAESNLLRAIPIFKGLSDRERVGLVESMALRTFEVGEAIVRQGEAGDSMFVLQEGSARAEVENIGHVKSYSPGEYFGELALLSDTAVGKGGGGLRSATVTAETAVSALEIGRSAFEELVGPLGANMTALRRHFHSASYAMGRRDYVKLFRHFDKDNSGFLEEEEFRHAVRKEGKTDATVMSERQLRVLYFLVDVDRDGLISETDFCAWLGVSNSHEYTAQLAKLKSERQEVLDQAQEIVRSDLTLEAGEKLREHLKAKDTLQAQIEDKERDISKQYRRDKRRIESFQEVSRQYQLANQAREQLRQQAGSDLTVDMVSELHDINARCLDYKELLEKAQNDLEKIVDPSLIQKAHEKVRASEEMASMGFSSLSPDEDASSITSDDTKMDAVEYLKSSLNVSADHRTDSAKSRRSRLVGFLKSPKLPFGGLSDDERLEVIRLLESQEFTAGQHIIQQDETGTELFIIESGSADVHVTGDGVVAR